MNSSDAREHELDVEVPVTEKEGVYYANFSELDRALDELFRSGKDEDKTDA